jgi:uncharacterized protein (TIGR02996 family)
LSTEDDLVAAVRAAPDDDASRMVYADWLQQHGDPLGEWLALSLAPPTPAIARRLDALAVELRWQERFGKDVAHDRGLVSRMKLTAPALTPELLDRLRGTLIRDLDLSGWRPSSVQWDVLMRAVDRMAPRRLRVAMYLPSDELAALLARCPGLDALELVHAELTDERAAALADALPAQLRRLVVTNYPYSEGSYRLIGDAGATALAASPRAAALRELTLRSTKIAATAAAALVDLPALERLDLAHNRLGTRGVVAMLDRPGIARLVCLDVTGADIGDRVAIALASSPAVASLRRLVLGTRARPTALTRLGIDALVASPHLSHELALGLDDVAVELRRDALTTRFRLERDD